MRSNKSLDPVISLDVPQYRLGAQPRGGHRRLRANRAKAIQARVQTPAPLPPNTPSRSLLAAEAVNEFLLSIAGGVV